VRSPRDLRGKTVGTAGIPYQQAYLRSILAKAGVPQDSVKHVNVGFNLGPAMISKRVDATLGAFWNYEGTDLERRGRKPVILRMEELGVPTYNELVFTARKRSLTGDEASEIRRFLGAVAKGAAIVRDQPEQAVDALLEANKDLKPALERAVVAATTEVFFPEHSGKPFGWQDPDAWRAYGKWMLDNDLVERDPLADNALTNEFLPGEGLQTDRTQY
jgi:putative hydroxymethylpyrimidine transport system substrate-binding protein